ncbi:MAG: type I methionyl aminopeptidase [Candidatus Gastranaerophilales bacterium]|nr:type I methionyl aminopeptidase [Candidatus Gastranaerophilales bacterium]
MNKKSREEIKLMRMAGNIVALVHQEMKKVIEPGISTLELDKIAYDIIKKNKAIPTFLGYAGFPNTICASINEQVVHGIPSKDAILKEGDIVSIDVGATFRGLVGDGAWTYPVGKIASEVQKLLEATEKSLFAGIQQMIPENRLENVSAAIEDVALENKLGIVRQYGGHGVGRNMHEEPFLFNYRTNSNVIIKQNCAIAIEPMLNLGCDEVHVLSDEWTVVTDDKKPSAHFEHTVVATSDGPLIMTELL